jgi:hypothetical protein
MRRAAAVGAVSPSHRGWRAKRPAERAGACFSRMYRHRTKRCWRTWGCRGRESGNTNKTLAEIQNVMLKTQHEHDAQPLKREDWREAQRAATDTTDQSEARHRKRNAWREAHPPAPTTDTECIADTAVNERRARGRRLQLTAGAAQPSPPQCGTAKTQTGVVCSGLEHTLTLLRHTHTHRMQFFHRNSRLVLRCRKQANGCQGGPFFDTAVVTKNLNF